MKIYRLAQKSDTLAEYLDFESTSMDKATLANLIKKNQLLGKDYQFAAKVTEGGKDYWFVFDQTDSTYNLTDINEWIENVDDDEALQLLGLEDGDLYIGDIGPLRDIRENPGEAYHYTTEEGWEGIQRDGFIRQGHGTGLYNRGNSGVFVSINPEEYATGTYGNVLLTIDLERFKTESGLKSLNIDVEEPVRSGIIKECLANKLEIDRSTDWSSDYSINTLIVGHNIPVKYIKASV